MTRTAVIGAGLVAGPAVLVACAGEALPGSKRRESSMKTRKLGTLEVSETRRRMHEHQRQLRAARRQEPGHRGHPRRPREGRDLLRHGRGLRPVHQRRARRRGARADPRPSRDRDQVRIRHRGTAGSTAGRSTSRKWSRARSSASGPTASTSTTSTGSIRTCRSRTWPARSRT